MCGSYPMEHDNGLERKRAYSFFFHILQIYPPTTPEPSADDALTHHCRSYFGLWTLPLIHLNDIAIASVPNFWYSSLLNNLERSQVTDVKGLPVEEVVLHGAGMAVFPPVGCTAGEHAPLLDTVF